MHSFSHLQTAVQLLSSYKCDEPFHIYLKKYFRSHPKHGSRDRKQISQLCYSCFRLGHSAKQMPLEQQILAGYFLCVHEPSALLEELKPEWNNAASLNVEEKLRMLSPAPDWQKIFPWKNALSDTVDWHAFSLSHFIQPLLFLRVRPGQHKPVREKLAGLPHKWAGEDTVAVENSTAVQHLLAINRDVVVQDHSSQRVAVFLQMIAFPGMMRVWDCCAASGGKSILAADYLPDIQLTVSDIRPSILSNLERRLAEAGVPVKSAFQADLTDDSIPLPETVYDLIIADVPCSGSGTWGRTPEQLYFHDPGKVKTYAGIQEKILQRVTPFIRPGGFLLYCTCSVFREENEEQVEKLLQSGHWRLRHREVLTGYTQRADTLFAALLEKTQN